MAGLSEDPEFKTAEDGVFENGLTVAVRRTRLAGLLEMVPNGWRPTERNLRCEGVCRRLLNEFPGEWWSFEEAARFLEKVPESGVLQEGELVRRLGWSGSSHHATERDRVERIYLLMKAWELAQPGYREGVVGGDDLAGICLELGLLFQSEDGDRGLTDLEVLPEFEMIRYRSWGRPWSGKLKEFVMPAIPESFVESRTDFERALWCLEQAGKFAEKKKVEVTYEKADFWGDVLGVDQVAYQGFIYVEGTESEFDREAPGEFELHTLKDSETLVVGEDGPKRITLPEHCRFIPMLREVIEDPTASAELRWRAASDLIEGYYPNRRQFEKSAELVRRMDLERGKGSEEEQQDEEDFDGLLPGPEMEVGSERFFVKGKAPELTIYSRMMEKANLEIWKLSPEKMEEVGDYGNHGAIVLELRRGFLSNLDDEGEDIWEEHEWFEEMFELERQWEVPLRMKPLRLQSATVVKVPVKEPGTYAIVERKKNGRSVYPFRIYETVLMKAGRKNADLYAIDPLTGEALEGVEVRPSQRWDDELHFISDYTGRLQAAGDFEDLGRAFLIRRSGGEWQLGMIRDSGSGPIWEETQKWQSFLVTSQPLYRPGQKVALAGWLKHIPRWSAGKKEKLEGVGIKIAVTDPTGREVWTGETKLDEFGGFTGEFQLGGEVVLGDYRVQLQAESFFNSSDPFAEPEREWREVKSSSRWHRGWHFEVGEVRKPDFQVELIPLEGGGEFEMMLEATYLSGEPVRGATVVAGLEGSPALRRFHPKRRWDDLFEPGYQWALPIPRQMPDWKSWAIWPGDSSLHDDYDGQDYDVTTKLKTLTDEHGRARLKFDAHFPFLNQFPYRVTVKAGVVEMTGRRVGTQKSWVHTGRPFEVFARPLKGFYHEGDEVTVEVGMINPAGDPKSGRGVLKLERVEDGEFEGVLKREVEVDESGVAQVSFTAPRGGQYRCVFVGGESERGFVLEVTGGEGVRRKYDELQIIAREPLMAEPGVLECLVCTQAESGRVWLFESLPYGLQRSPRQVETRDHQAVVKVRVHESQRPNFFLNGLTYHEGKVSHGHCKVLFPDEASRLKVEMSLAEKEGRPGDRAKVELGVLSHDGRPAEVGLALTVFDRALEDVSSPLPSTELLRRDFRYGGGVDTSVDPGWRETPLFPSLYEPGVFSERDGLEGKVVRREDSYFVMIGREIWNGYHPPELPNQGGSGFPVTPATPSLYAYSRAGGGELSDEEFGLVDQVKARSRFTDQAYWGGALRTDRDGRLEVGFDLPDNLTTWRLQSWAFGKERSFGEARLELPVSKELQVRPMLPRAAVVGDELVVGAIVQNFSEVGDEFVITLETDGIVVKDAGARVVSLEAGDEGFAKWRVVMDEAGGAVVRVKVLGRKSKLADGFEQRVPVATKEIQRTVSGAVTLAPGASGVVLETAGDPGMKGKVVTVRAEANPVVSALLVLPDLASYPYGCVEQTLSRFLPLMIASKAVGDLGLKWSEMTRVFKKRDESLGWLNGRQASEVREVEVELTEEKEADMISVGIHRLNELQRSGGSWGWFSADDSEARVDMTALALRGLLLADARGSDGRRLCAIDLGVRWLEGWSELEITETTEVRTLAEAAFAAWVLREAESKKVAGLIARMSKVLTKLPTTSKIHLALAMEKSPERGALIRGIREEISEDKKVQPGFRSWWNAEVERRAYFLKLLVKTGAEVEELNAGIDWLLQARVDGVRWRHTRESALCVEAIIEAMLAQGRDFSIEDEVQRVIVSGPGGDRRIVLSKKNLWTESIELPVADHWKSGLLIRARSEGAEGLRMAASMSHRTSEEALMQASEDGLKVERKYYRLGSGEARTLIAEDEELKVGEMIEVVLEISADGPRGFLHVRDAILAGLEQLIQLSGFHQGAFRQNRTGEAHFFLNELRGGSRRLSYPLNVVTEGVSLALPAQVECMYAPDLRGQSDSRKFTVER